MVEPSRVVVGVPRVIGFKAVFQIVKLYVPHPASRLPVPHTVELGNAPEGTLSLFLSIVLLKCSTYKIVPVSDNSQDNYSDRKYQNHCPIGSQKISRASHISVALLRNCCLIIDCRRH